MWELLRAGRLDGDYPTVTGHTMTENLSGRESTDREVIKPFLEHRQLIGSCLKGAPHSWSSGLQLTRDVLPNAVRV